MSEPQGQQDGQDEVPAVVVQAQAASAASSTGPDAGQDGED